jgi:electron transfer flavoprotein alpha subunit
MASVLAFAESRGGALRKAALEAVGAARTLADQMGGGEVHVLLAGAPGIAQHAARLGAAGADVVIVVEHPALANYDPESLTATIAERMRAGGHRAFVLTASAQGRDLAPRVAARLDAGMLSDVISLAAQGDAIVAKHPVYAGKVIATLALAGTPAVITLRPNAFAPAESAKAGRVESAAPAADPSASRVRVTETIQGRTGRPDLGEAPIIVSGGRGLKAPENFKLVEELADAFGNAAVGATRAVTDEGWRPHSDQIGQTGRSVSPQLYVAVGISGAIQHLAGMRTSRTIVAINKDREAPIFKLADYGIVGDALEIVPALTKAIRAVREHG